MKARPSRTGRPRSWRRARCGRPGPLAAFVVSGALMLGALASAPLAAQTTPSLAGGAGAHFQHFLFTDEDAAGTRSISLLSMPFSGSARLTPSVRLEASSTLARGSLKRPGRETTVIQGLTDSRLQVLAELLDGRVSLTGSVSAPTGVDGFTSEEADLAGALAADLLPFRISSWGTGGGFGAGASVFQRMAPATALTVGAAVATAGEFTPLDAQDYRYRPGPTLRVQAVIDHTIGVAGRAALQLGYQRYGDDRVEGENLFRSGDRIQARASYSFAAGFGGSAVVYAGYLHRSAGTVLADLAPRPSQGLLYTGGILRHPWRGMVAVPAVELRVHRRDDGEDQGTLAGAGLSLEIPRGDLVLIPQAQLRGGTVLLYEGTRSGLIGTEIGFSVRHGRR